MKCISCGNEIPNSSTICPFCGKDVQPIESGVTPTYDAPEQQDFNAVPLVKQEDTPMQSAPVDGVPATPDAPVLPQDQGMMNTPVAPAVPVGNEVSPADVAIPPVPGSEEKKEEPKKDMDMTPPVVPATSGVMTNPTSPEAATISNQGEMTDGVRESSSAIVEKDKKKNKNKKVVKVVVIVLVVLLLVAGGVFGYAYYSQTQTASKRLNTIIDQIIKFDGNINQTLTQASGKYSLSGELTEGGQNASAKLSGIYAYDVDKKIMDYTFNIEKLNMEGTELIDKDPLNIELYLADSNVYVLLQNFYDKYIYTEVEGLDQIFESLKENDVDYKKILEGIKAAMKSAINAAGKSQTVKDISIGDIKKKANVVTITLTSKNLKAIEENFLRTLANNSDLLKEVAKVSAEVTEDQLKEQLETEIKELEEPEVKDPTIVEIYTAMFDNEFYGIRLTNTAEDAKDDKIELYPITDGYKLIVVDEKNEVLNISYTHKKQRTSSEIEDNYNIDAVIASDEDVIKLKLEYNNIADVTPKVERVNTKESIKLENLTEADLNSIVEKISNFGNLGLIFKSLIESNSNIGGITGGIDNPYGNPNTGVDYGTDFGTDTSF